MKLEEADSEEEEPELEDNGNSKAHSSKTNNHSSKANNRMNQTNYNYIDEKDYDSFQLFEEFNVGFDNDVTLFTKMDFMNLKHCEKKCLSDLNKKTFNHYVTFSIYLNGEEDLEEEENFLTKNTNEYTQRNTKIIDRINLLGCNEIKY